jgi:hypothetical protein
MANKDQRSTKEKKKPKADVKAKPVSAYKAAFSSGGGSSTISQPNKKP